MGYPIITLAPEGLAMHLPIKQGLKHWDIPYSDIDDVLAMHLPIKQGLKLCVPKRGRPVCDLAMHLPIKQGLKPGQNLDRCQPPQGSQCTFQ